jgi:PAS domain S-box-containing protein
MPSSPADTPSRQSFRIAASYGIVASGWILFSDQAVAWYFTDPHALTIAAMIKGWFFVLVTGAVLFLLVRRQLRKVSETAKAQQLAEAAVHRSEERFRALTTLSPDIISIFDREGHLTFNSAAALKIHGYREEDVLGQTTFNLVHPDDRESIQAAFAEALRDPTKTVLARYRYRNADGSYRWMEALGSNQLDNPDIQGIISISRDISQQVRAEDERRAMQEQLLQAQKMEAIGQLAGGVAHDFNNILTVISLNLETLKNPDPDTNVGNVAAEIEAATQRATALTRQLLLFARRQAVQKRPIDLNQLIGRLLAMLRRLIGENIAMEFRPASLPVWVHADAGMLEQVIVNLAVNARDAMPHGGHLVIAVSLQQFESTPAHPTRRSGRFACVSVEDNGCGIEPAAQGRIFEPFYTTKKEGKGTGLGLATVFGIVEQHEGWIELESTVGHGATFRVALPSSDKGFAPPDPIQAQPAGGQESILVVEDDNTIRLLCMRVLRRLGYRAAEASQGNEALEVWQQHQGAFDLLLTDMIMPGGLSGLDVAHRLRTEKPELKVIVMSGYSLELKQLGNIDTKEIAYLAKPFTPAALAQSIRLALTQPRQ